MAVLELMATLATALVAVTLGIRLIGGAVTLRSALTVLVLTPELYAPLRSLGAQYHASADGLAAVERIFELIGSGPGAAVGSDAPPEAWDEVRLERVGMTYPGRAGRSSTGSICRSAEARSWPSSVPADRERPRSPGCSSGSAGRTREG